MKVFISQSTIEKTDLEIKTAMEKAIVYLETKYGKIEPVSSYPTPDYYDCFQALGRSISMFGNIDAAYFIPGWELSRDCILERDVCRAYEIQILE